MVARRGPHQTENSLFRARNRSVPVSIHIPERKRSQAGPHRHESDEHAEIADAIDDKRLVSGIRSALALDVKPDQKVRTNADQFPEHEDHGHIACQDQTEHAETEQGHVLKKSREAARSFQVRAVFQRHFMVGHRVQFVVHVTERIEMDARRDQRHHAEHDHGQRVNVIADGDPKFAELRPGRNSRPCTGIPVTLGSAPA